LGEEVKMPSPPRDGESEEEFMARCMKQCSKCRKQQSLSGFYKDRRSTDGLQSACKFCHNEYYRRPEVRQRTNEGKRRKYEETGQTKSMKKALLKYRKTEKFRRVAEARRLKRKYGITLEQYKQMLEAQEGVCAICKRPEVSYGRIKDWRIRSPKRLSVDHNHKTGKIRGLLCNTCNWKLGVFEDKEFKVEVLKYLGEVGQDAKTA
jgi:hypothetical protein